MTPIEQMVHELLQRGYVLKQKSGFNGVSYVGEQLLAFDSKLARTCVHAELTTEFGSIRNFPMSATEFWMGLKQCVTTKAGDCLLREFPRQMIDGKRDRWVQFKPLQTLHRFWCDEKFPEKFGH
jgi:hypothetical protein